jgi:putative hydrolase of the HAD superfamily
MTKAVLFDLGDTVFKLGPFDVAALRARFAGCLGERCGLELERAAAVVAEMDAKLQEALRLSYQDGQTAEPAMASRVLEHLLEFDGHSEWLASEFDRFFGEADTSRWEEPAGRHEFFDGLRSRGLRLGFVSNTITMPPLMDARLTDFALRQYADVAIYSVAVGHRKPNPAIYQAALGALGVAADDVLFVGDRVREDVRGPQAVGMRAVLTHEFRQEEPGDAAPLAVIRELGEVLDFVGRRQ